ncbi:hypothetical protein ZHAS_00007375 [Anopheles sinensis]|uniref:Uncharacterized protein n=1 Tax=Anopheles sinensis TaxID=74873 RepID=A0A084VPU3_ANOSI|nr:hypothetical protein ZHAS_00007375 [Anopheles sinensis]
MNTTCIIRREYTASGNGIPKSESMNAKGLLLPVLQLLFTPIYLKMSVRRNKLQRIVSRVEAIKVLQEVSRISGFHPKPGEGRRVANENPSKDMLRHIAPLPSVLAQK